MPGIRHYTKSAWSVLHSSQTLLLALLLQLYFLLSIYCVLLIFRWANVIHVGAKRQCLPVQL